MQKCGTVSNKDTFKENNILSPKLTHPDLTTLNTRSTNFISFNCFSCKFSFYNDPLIPSLHFPFPTHLSLIGTHTCMQLETFSLELKGHTSVESCPDALWGWRPYLLWIVLKLDTVGNQQFSL